MLHDEVHRRKRHTNVIKITTLVGPNNKPNQYQQNAHCISGNKQPCYIFPYLHIRQKVSITCFHSRWLHTKQAANVALGKHFPPRISCLSRQSVRSKPTRQFSLSDSPSVDLEYDILLQQVKWKCFVPSIDQPDWTLLLLFCYRRCFHHSSFYCQDGNNHIWYRWWYTLR